MSWLRTQHNVPGQGSNPDRTLRTVVRTNHEFIGPSTESKIVKTETKNTEIGEFWPVYNSVLKKAFLWQGSETTFKFKFHWDVVA